MKAFVIAVAGVHHSGAYELCDELAGQFFHSAAVHFRDFTDSQPVRNWLEGEDSFDGLELSTLRSRLEEMAGCRKYSCLFLDCPVGRSAEELRGLVDFVFYLDVPLDIALIRSLFQDPRLTDRGALRSRLRLYQDSGRAIAQKIQRVVSRDADVTVYAEKDPESTLFTLTKRILENRFIKF